MPEKNEKPFELTTRAMPVTPESLNEKDRSVLCTASTEVPVVRWFQGEYVDEVISVKSWTYPDKVPLLDCHSYWRTSDVRGSCTEITITDVLSAKLTLATTQAANDDWTLIKEKHLDSVSVGYVVRKYQYIEAGQSMVIGDKTYTASKERAMLVALETLLYEISLVPLPADEFAKIRSNPIVIGKRSQINNNSQERGGIMPEKKENGGENNTPKTPVTEPETRTTKPATDNVEEVVKAAVEKERKRISEIKASCRSLGLSEEFENGLIANGTSIEEANGLIVKEAAKRQKPINNETRITVDSVDNVRSALVMNVKRSFNCISKEEQGNLAKSEFNGIRSPIDIAKAILESRGVRTTYMPNHDVYSAIRQQGMADFVYIVGSAANASLESIFEQNIATVEKWTDAKDVSDFNTHDFWDVTPLPIMPAVADKAELTSVTIVEYAESGKLGTTGYAVPLSRQAFISGQFNTMADQLVNIGEAAAQTLESMVYSKLESNPTMKDAVALFHANHHNLGSGALNSDNLTTAKTTFKRMTIGSGQKIGGIPKFLIVPTELADDAFKLCYSVTDITGSNPNVKNPHTGIEVIDSYYLTDANDWYLAGTPGKTITRLYLNGVRTPQVKIDESRGTEALGFTFVVVFDVAVLVRSPFYLYKSANANS